MAITLRNRLQVNESINCLWEEINKLKSGETDLSGYVKTTTDQNVGGIKTFTSSPIFTKIPTFTDTYANGQASFGSDGQGGRILFNRGSDGALGFAIGFSGQASTTGYITSNAAMYVTAVTSTVIENTGSGGSVNLSATHATGYVNIVSGNAQAVRIFATGNLNIGGTTDTLAPLQITKSVNATSGTARGINLIPTLVATANNDQLYAVDIIPTYTNGAFTGVGNWAIRHQGSIIPNGDNIYSLGAASVRYNNIYTPVLHSGAGNLSIRNNTVIGATQFTSGRWAFQNGGTYADDGVNQVQITGATSITGTTTIKGIIDVYGGAGINLVGSDSASSTTRTNTTDKSTALALPHYTSSEEPVGLIYATSSSGVNTIRIGGGVSTVNTASSIRFYTATSSNIVTGSERMVISATGTVTINTPSSGDALSVSGAVGIAGATTITGTLNVSGITTITNVLDVYGGGVENFIIGSDTGSAITRTNGSNKVGRLSFAHHTNAEEPIALINGTNTSTTANVNIGGGTIRANCATRVSIYTAADVVTTTGSERIRIDSAGSVMIGSFTTDGVNMLQVSGSIKTSQYRLAALNTAPSSATDTGTTGEFKVDGDYIHFCVATNTWKRAALVTWP